MGRKWAWSQMGDKAKRVQVERHRRARQARLLYEEKLPRDGTFVRQVFDALPEDGTWIGFWILSAKFNYWKNQKSPIPGVLDALRKRGLAARAGRGIWKRAITYQQILDSLTY